MVVDSSNIELDIESCGLMFAVADGMSGHSGGLMASRMACEGLLSYYMEESDAKRSDDLVRSSLTHLENIILKIHEKIEATTGDDGEYEHMGTTLSVLVLLKGKAFFAHVGDSRIYRFRDSNLFQLSKDHTMAQLSMEMGYIKPEDVCSSPQRHILLQSVGEGIDEIQTGILETETHDVFLLCSDGLYNMVPDDKIKEILCDDIADDQYCDKLVQAALENGGEDNITAIVIKI